MTNQPCTTVGCEKRHCTTCSRPYADPPTGGAHLQAHELYVCDPCIATVRRTIGDILTLADLLPGEVVDGNLGARIEPRFGGSRDHAGPGGDALVALAPGNTHADDQDALDSDPESVAAVLMHWEDRFRRLLGQPAAWFGDGVSAAKWLDGHLRTCAAVPPVRQLVLAGEDGVVALEATGTGHMFAAMAYHLRQLRGRLEGITGGGVRTAYAGARCLDCDEDELVWGQHDPEPCTHGPRPPYPDVPAFPDREPLRPGVDLVERERRHGAAFAEWRQRRDRLVAEWRAAVAVWEQEHMACLDPGRERDGHDQGGRRDQARCRACGREYTSESYALALRDKFERERAQRKAETA